MGCSPPEVFLTQNMTTEYHQNQKNQDPPAGPLQVSDVPEVLSCVSAGGPPDLLYLYSNICTETTESEKTDAILGLTSLLTPYHKKAAQTLHVNVERLILEAPSLGHVGFLTLTFKDNVTDNSEASRRFKSLNSHFLATDPRFGIKIVVKEPQKRGAWHYHVLVHLSEDIRTGFDFAAMENQDYSSASPYLRKLWKDIREACEAYGFGRSELLPVKSNAQAMGYYLGKYISKGIGQRNDEQKGVRLVNYSKGWTRNSPKFAWNTQNAALWRSKLSLFAKIHGCQEFYQLSDKLGPNWAYRYLEDIINIHEIDIYHQYQYLEDGSRVDRQTGETTTSDQLNYSDRIFKRIEENDKTKTHLLHAEYADLLSPKSTYKHWQKTQRKKDQDRAYVFQVKSEWSALLDWLKKQPEPPF